MSTLSLHHANIIIATALEHGREAGLKPLTVAVLDAGGHLVALQRANGSSNLRPQIITGDTSDNDDSCALAGIKAAGLIAKG